MKGTTSTSAIFRRMDGKITIALLFDDENGLRAYDRKVGYSGPNRTDLFVFVLNHSEPAYVSCSQMQPRARSNDGLQT